MNIAVITFSDFNTNYGSILQAYAMRCFLESMGHTVSFIRYREFQTPNFSIKGFLYRAYSTLEHYRFRERIETRQNNFQKFIGEHIPHTRLYTSEWDLENNLPIFDAYICGSDQIWNIPDLGGLREPYFLKFAPSNKRTIAYAPSMGDYQGLGAYEIEFKKSLRYLDCISCREEYSVNILKKLTGGDVKFVVDPVFLLSAEEWKSKMGGRVPGTPEKYGLCYIIRRNPLCEYLVLELSRRYNMPFYNISNNLCHIKGTDNKFVACGPDMFIRLIAHASVCVGSSFHLAAFSIIFEKEFYVAGSEHLKSRVLSLLKLVDLEYLFVLSKDDADAAMNKKNKKASFKRLDDVIYDSKKYLNLSLNG